MKLNKAKYLATKIVVYAGAIALLIGICAVGIMITAWVFRVDMEQAFWIWLWRG